MSICLDTAKVNKCLLKHRYYSLILLWPYYKTYSNDYVNNINHSEILNFGRRCRHIALLVDNHRSTVLAANPVTTFPEVE